MKRRFVMSLFLLVTILNGFAAKVDTIRVFSDAMKKEFSSVVVTPDRYTASKPLPVVYILHGYSDSYKNGWISKIKNIQQYADLYQMILVMPDGGFSSWYYDSPVDSSIRYESYICKELIPYVDKHFATIKSRTGRAITGNSMGGHGALYLSFLHQDLFGAAGSTSGGVDIRPFPGNWDLSKRLGTIEEHPENWEKYTVTNMTHLLKGDSLAIIFDCGSSDFFYKVNCEFHQKLLDQNIPHDFISRPGAHNWEYWTNALQYQMVYFTTYFKAKNK